MEYAKIIAITGMPGLYEMVSSKGDGAIVRSLDDQSTKFVSGRVHHFTHLESIEVYTERENVNLTEVLNAMKDSKEQMPDEKDNKALQSYFRKVYPALDFDRVYASDMKKMVKWLDVLKKNNVEIQLSEPEEELQEEVVEEKTKEPKAKAESKAEAKTETEKPAKKAAKTKEAEAKTSVKKETKEEEKPKKAKATSAKEEPKKSTKKAETKKATAKKTEPAKKK